MRSEPTWFFPRLGMYLVSNRRDVFPLKSGHRELPFGRLARAIRSGDRRRPVRRPSPCFIDLRQFGARVGQADVDEPMVQQRGDKSENGGFVTAAGTGAYKDAGHFS